MSQYLLASFSTASLIFLLSPVAPGPWLCSGLGCSDLCSEASSLSQGHILVHCWYIHTLAAPRMAPRVPHPSPAGVSSGAVLSGSEGLSYLVAAGSS